MRPYTLVFLAFAVATSPCATLLAEPPQDGVRVLTDVPYKQADGLTEHEQQR